MKVPLLLSKKRTHFFKKESEALPRKRPPCFIEEVNGIPLSEYQKLVEKGDAKPLIWNVFAGNFFILNTKHKLLKSITLFTTFSEMAVEKICLRIKTENLDLLNEHLMKYNINKSQNLYKGKKSHQFNINLFEATWSSGHQYLYKQFDMTSLIQLLKEEGIEEKTLLDLSNHLNAQLNQFDKNDFSRKRESKKFIEESFNEAKKAMQHLSNCLLNIDKRTIEFEEIWNTTCQIHESEKTNKKPKKRLSTIADHLNNTPIDLNKAQKFMLHQQVPDDLKKTTENGSKDDATFKRNSEEETLDFHKDFKRAVSLRSCL